MNTKKLYKISSQRKIAGVCAGIAEYINADVTLVRILAILLIFFSFSAAIFIYIACAIIMPDKNELI